MPPYKIFPLKIEKVFFPLKIEKVSTSHIDQPETYNIKVPNIYIMMQGILVVQLKLDASNIDKDRH